MTTGSAAVAGPDPIHFGEAAPLEAGTTAYQAWPLESGGEGSGFALDCATIQLVPRASEGFDVSALLHGDIERCAIPGIDRVDI